MDNASPLIIAKVNLNDQNEHRGLHLGSSGVPVIPVDFVMIRTYLETS